jgi:hypothetical protein
MKDMSQVYPSLAAAMIDVADSHNNVSNHAKTYQPAQTVRIACIISIVAIKIKIEHCKTPEKVMKGRVLQLLIVYSKENITSTCCLRIITCGMIIHCH